MARRVATAPQPGPLASPLEPLASPSEVAGMLGIPEHTLAQWRSKGSGPKYIKVGRHVRYRWSAVDAWLNEQTTSAAVLA